MTKAFKSIVLISLFVSLSTGTALALEALSNNQMKDTCAQAGIDIAVSHMPNEMYVSSLAFSNTDDANQYISLNGIHILSTLNIGNINSNGDNFYDPLSIDVGSYYDRVMILVESPDMRLSTDMTIENIDFCGTNLGSLSVESMDLTSVYLYAGPHDGSGIDFELGHRSNISTLAYHYNSQDALTLSGISFAGSFDPFTGAASGAFRIGDIKNNNPATFDMSVDSQANFAMIDNNVDTYSIANPRYNSAYMALSMPMSGSIRINNISNTTNVGGSNQTSTDLGLLAIDGINAHKLYIEIPGRGLGKP